MTCQTCIIGREVVIKLKSNSYETKNYLQQIKNAVQVEILNK